MKGKIKCMFCGYEFDSNCGEYGCPNCLGEGLASDRVVMLTRVAITTSVLFLFAAMMVV